MDPKHPGVRCRLSYSVCILDRDLGLPGKVVSMMLLLTVDSYGLPDAAQTDKGHSAVALRGCLFVLLTYRCKGVFSAHEGAIPLERDQDRRFRFIL
jgi:hypothetical protein